jgi:hypothetical protein
VSAGYSMWIKTYATSRRQRGHVARPGAAAPGTAGHRGDDVPCCLPTDASPRPASRRLPVAAMSAASGALLGLADQRRAGPDLVAITVSESCVARSPQRARRHVGPAACAAPAGYLDDARMVTPFPTIERLLRPQLAAGGSLTPSWTRSQDPHTLRPDRPLRPRRGSPKAIPHGPASKQIRIAN